MSAGILADRQPFRMDLQSAICMYTIDSSFSKTCVYKNDEIMHASSCIYMYTTYNIVRQGVHV